jgi:phage terminase small subunit
MSNFEEPKMPKDLDREARRKWGELTEMADLGELDADLLASFCRNHSNLMEVRKVKKAQQKAKQFQTMTVAKNGSTVLNPLIVAESRLMQAGGRMLVQLGISGNGKRQETLRKPKATPPPAGFSGPEPPWGWAIEEKLCRNKLEDWKQ